MQPMFTITIDFFVFVLCSLTVRVNSLTFQWAPCSEFVPCESLNNTCSEPDHICVYHPECHGRPVCYSLSIIARQTCPPIAMIQPPLDLSVQARWKQNGITIAGGHGEGNGLHQLSGPQGLHIDGETIYIADDWNHRIVEWKIGATSGQVVAGGNERGDRTDQLNRPSDVVVDRQTDSLIICDWGNRRVMRWSLRSCRSGGTMIISNIDCRGVTIDDQGFLYASDMEKHEVRRYHLGEISSDGVVVAGGHGKGNRLNQLDTPTYVFVDRDHSVFVSDGWNHRVMKWMKDAKEGIVVAGSQSIGNALTQIIYPQGVFVDSLGTVYVTDFPNHRVMRWYNRAAQGSVIAGGNDQGQEANQLHFPKDLSFDRHGNLYVVDRKNHRVQRFDIEQS